MLLENSNSTSQCDCPNLINRNRDMHYLFSVCTGLRSLRYVVALYNDNQAKYRLITFCPAIHHFIYICAALAYCGTFTHLGVIRRGLLA